MTLLNFTLEPGGDTALLFTVHRQTEEFTQFLRRNYWKASNGYYITSYIFMEISDVSLFFAPESVVDEVLQVKEDYLSSSERDAKLDFCMNAFFDYFKHVVLPKWPGARLENYSMWSFKIELDPLKHQDMLVDEGEEI